jgi:DNA gyrase subunit A
MICGVEGIKNYFTTGKGSVKLRGRVGAEEFKGNREQLVITEIPFNVNRAALEEKIAELVNEKIITEISAMRNESDENTRLVMELKRDGNPKVVIANLYKHTQLEVSRSASIRSRLTTASRRRSPSRKSSSATSSIAAKWFCAARVLN